MASLLITDLGKAELTVAFLIKSGNFLNINNFVELVVLFICVMSRQAERKKVSFSSCDDPVKLLGYFVNVLSVFVVYVAALNHKESFFFLSLTFLPKFLSLVLILLLIINSLSVSGVSEDLGAGAFCGV